MAWSLNGPLERLRQVSPVRVDLGVAVGLLIGIEIVALSSPGIHARVPAVVGGLVLSGSVAVRRRWPLEALVAGNAAVVVQDVLGGNLIRTSVATIPAGILFSMPAPPTSERAARGWRWVSGCSRCGSMWPS
jgi:hypothetical protein